MAENTLFQADAGWLTAAVETLRASGLTALVPTETEPGVFELTPAAADATPSFDYVNTRTPLKAV